MNAFWFEKLSQLRILMNDITQMYLVNIRIVGSVSESGPEEHPRQQGKSFKTESQIPELIKENRQGWQYENLERILIPLTTIVDSFQRGEYTIQNVLHISVERRTYSRRVFWFSDVSGIEVILQIGIVSRSPLELPSNVVWIACSPADFVVSQRLEKTLCCCSS